MFANEVNSWQTYPEVLENYANEALLVTKNRNRILILRNLKTSQFYFLEKIKKRTEKLLLSYSYYSDTSEKVWKGSVKYGPNLLLYAREKLKHAHDDETQFETFLLLFSLWVCYYIVFTRHKPWRSCPMLAWYSIQKQFGLLRFLPS